MKEIAPGVWQLSAVARNLINVYLVGDVLIDAGAKPDRRRILKQLQGRPLSAHALTHAHADHQGASKAVCETFGVPFWVHEADAPAAEEPRVIKERQPNHPINTLFFKLFAGPGHPVDRRLHEGDEVAGFEVLHVPGHSAGHVAFWRESDRVLIAGDVITTIDTLTLLPGLREPKKFFTPDPAQNRLSIKRIAALEPAVVAVGHGPPLRDPAKLSAFAASLD
jgi:glyoxylase-like metal-dependent hydrolase (beta-lactamase superfamily II)